MNQQFLGSGKKRVNVAVPTLATQELSHRGVHQDSKAPASPTALL